MNIGKLKIKKGFWWGAGSPKVFNWKKDGWHQHGIGINTELLDKYEILEIEVEGKKYSLETSAAKKFAKHFNSYKQIYSNRLAIVSRSLLYPYDGIN